MNPSASQTGSWNEGSLMNEDVGSFASGGSSACTDVAASSAAGGGGVMVPVSMGGGSGGSSRAHVTMGSTVCGANGLQTVTSADLLTQGPSLVASHMSMFPHLEGAEMLAVASAISSISKAVQSGNIAFQQGVQMVDKIEGFLQSTSGGSQPSQVGVGDQSDASGLGVEGVSGAGGIPGNIDIGNQSDVSGSLRDGVCIPWCGKVEGCLWAVTWVGAPNSIAFLLTVVVNAGWLT